jgi:2-phosphosulfolactate phosphatase
MKSNQSKKQIQITVHFTPTDLDEMQLKDKNIVIIDVLRASTTIAAALQNGAKEIIPVNSVENAVKISGSLFGDVTLRAGERNSKMIEGFNLGNSPSEFTEDVVKGKSIILMTTNGSVAIRSEERRVGKECKA